MSVAQRAFLNEKQRKEIFSKPIDYDRDPDLLAMNRGKYTAEDKFRVVTNYINSGSLNKAAQLSGIDVEAVKNWKQDAAWWDDAINHVRKLKQEELDHQITSLIDQFVDELGDRVKNGDHVVAKDGSLIRKPLTARDLSLSFAILFDKRALMRGDPTSRNEKVSQDDMIKQLENKFADLAKRIDEKRVNVVSEQ